jgi:hypothetical protein
MASNASLIRKLESAMPVMDKRRKQQQDEARTIQLQQQVAAAPSGINVPQAAQQLGVQQAAAAGQQAVTNEAAQQQQRSALAQQALQSQATQQENILAQQQAGLQRQQIQSEADLSTKKRQNIDKIANAQMEFKRDEQGRVEYQESQLMDYAIATAKSEQDLKDTLADIQWATEQELEIMSAANDRLKSLLHGEQQIELQKYSQEQRAALAEYQRSLERELERKQARAANGAMIGGGIGTIAGAYFGPVGSAAGGAAGSYIGGQMA